MGPTKEPKKSEAKAKKPGLPENKRATLSEIPVKTLYTQDDVKDIDFDNDIGQPGKFPFTRGLTGSGYRSRKWTMRMFAGHKTAKDTNERFKYLLEHGQTGLSTAFDLPTLMGLDSDDPFSLGEVGREGVAVDSLQDMEELYAGIDLGKVSTSMTINLPAPMILAMYFAIAEKQGVPFKRLRGTCQTDILKEFIAQNEYMYPPEPSMRLVLDLIEYTVDNVPKFFPISISGYHIREAGASAVQELAFTLADGREYVKRLVARGRKVDDFARQLSFFFDSHNYFFEEIAKFRAGRRIWARWMKEDFGATKITSMMLPCHTQTAGVSLTAQQPMNNLARVAYQAMAGVLGGTMSLHTNSFDEALALPTDKAARLALRTQQVIAEESGVTDTVDPFGGSYYLEALTDEVEKRTLDLIRQIDDLGGLVPALEKGFFHREIAETAYRFEVDVAAKRRKIVGVNVFDTEGQSPDILKIHATVEQQQIDKLRKLKKDRDNKAVEAALDRLADVAKTQDNVMPAVYEAVKTYATIGEMVQALKGVFGEYPAIRY